MVSDFIICLGSLFGFFFLGLQQLLVGKRERENHRYDFLVSASISNSHGIIFYYLPWVFVLFSILEL